MYSTPDRGIVQALSEVLRRGASNLWFDTFTYRRHNIRHELLGLPDGIDVVDQMEGRRATAQTKYNYYKLYSTYYSDSYIGYQSVQSENLLYR